MKIQIIYKFLILCSLSFLFLACNSSEGELSISGKHITISYNNLLYSRINSDYSQTHYVTNEFSPSEYLIVDNRILKDFVLASQSKEINDGITSLTLTGKYSSNGIELSKELKVKIYDDFPDFAFTKVRYTNNGTDSLLINGWVNNEYRIPQSDNSQVFWSYQSGSYENRPDWVLPVEAGFKQENYMGMNASDYGNGTPVSDVWTKDIGLAVGHVELVPKLVYLPVSRYADTSEVELKIKYLKDGFLYPGESIETFTTFVSVHKGDYFKTLTEYSKFMQQQGVTFKPITEDAYEPIWCAWGYERNFSVSEVLNTIPKVKELGLNWAVLDDGWQTAEGDWYLNPKKFPNGDKDMIAFVNRVHEAGLKAKLWWVPLAVDPGTDLIKEHPDLLLLNEDGKPEDISWWDSYYLCPAYQPTIDYTKKLVEKFIVMWGYDGLKIDGQHLNGAPPCYNPEHHHKYPEESVEAMPDFFKTIFETALNFKKNSVIEVCPCGTAYNFFMLPYLNQVVASDPTSSRQIRIKGKTFKALMSPNAPYYGDHVELSDDKSDFASTIGIGGIIGTKFTWPVGVYLNTESGDVSLTPQKEKDWKKWIKTYKEYMLPKGNYLGELYDIGFDKPEAHAIQKDGIMYYAFYANDFEGKIEFRGLDKKKEYHIEDYVNNKSLGEIEGANPFLNLKFDKYLLVKVTVKN